LTKPEPVYSSKFVAGIPKIRPFPLKLGKKAGEKIPRLQQISMPVPVFFARIIQFYEKRAAVQQNYFFQIKSIGK